jgi:hypothetical protein
MSTQQRKSFNGLTDAQLERLALVIEECAEVQQIACKVLRHGYSSNNQGKLAEINRHALAREVGDLLHVIDRLINARDIDGLSVATHSSRKAAQIDSWLHYQGSD